MSQTDEGTRAIAPARRRDVVWMRAGRAPAWFPVVDRRGAAIGRVVAVGLAADGAATRYDVEVRVAGLPFALKRLAASQTKLSQECLMALMDRREVASLPDAGADASSR